jgi:hypothetical protein
LDPLPLSVSQEQGHREEAIGCVEVPTRHGGREGPGGRGEEAIEGYVHVALTPS